MLKNKQLIVIGGPTAIGKTAAAITLAKKYNTEIISADSRQVYRQLNIGVGRPDTEQLNTVSHHLIATIDIEQHYHASNFEQDALDILKNIYQHKNKAIVCGGTGLYIQALCDGLDDMPKVDFEIRSTLNKRFEEEGISFLQQIVKENDPELFKTIDILNHKRLIRAAEIIIQTGKPYSYFRKGSKSNRYFSSKFFCLYNTKDVIKKNITIRVHKMFESGWLDECIQLYPLRHLKALQTVGYKEIFQHLDGAYTYDETIKLIITRTYQYAKRQLTWFKRDDRYHWVKNVEEIENILEA